MQIYLKEKIGKPELFTGRKKELTGLLLWAENIKEELSKSTAILSRRKTGKSALLQRLYNIIFHKNNGLIPFYYEIKEYELWIVEFATDFFLSFLSQYLGFQTRNIEYINVPIANFDSARRIIQKHDMSYLSRFINDIEKRVIDQDESVWDLAREAPRRIAALRDERVLQIIDEFQYMGKMIYHDKELTRPFTGMAGTYFHTAEYRNAPLLISGSWIGWLLKYLGKHLHGRFKRRFLDNMTQDESIEMIYNYSLHLKIPVDEKTVPLICDVTRGNPFYISALFYSEYEDKDLTTEEGIQKTLEFEITDERGDIRNTWMEYIDYAFAEINGENPPIAKNIVMYLCQNRDREVSRKEIRDNLNITITDAQLEKRLDSLVLNDIVERGKKSYFYYQGIKDHVFDKVFRFRYADEITDFDPKEITNEYKALFEKSKAKNASLQSQYNNLKGRFGEYMVIRHLRFHAHNANEHYCGMTENLPDDFEFVKYKTVWRYTGSVILNRNFEIDIFADADEGQYSLIGEVKNRIGSFNEKEAENFLNKARELIEMEDVKKRVLFVLCVGGFTDGAIEFFKEHEIAWSENEGWL
jgi:hypothetical protein